MPLDDRPNNDDETEDDEVGRQLPPWTRRTNRRNRRVDHFGAEAALRHPKPIDRTLIAQRAPRVGTLYRFRPVGETEGSLEFWDEGLYALIERATAKADVRGWDYVGDTMADHLSHVVFEREAEGSDDDRRYDPELIRRELAGLEPISRDRTPNKPIPHERRDAPTTTTPAPDADSTYPAEMNPKQAALLIGVTPSAISQMISSKRLAAERRGRELVIRGSDLAELQRSRSARTPHERRPVFTPEREDMPVVEPIGRPPILSIPVGSLWVRRRGEHEGETVRIRRVNDHSVMFHIEKKGHNQGSRSFVGLGQELRQRKGWFLNHYEPASNRDWELASHAVITPPPPPVENGTADEPPPEQQPPLTAQMEVDPDVEPAEPIAEPVATEPSPATPRIRPYASDIVDSREVADIVDFWRSGVSAPEIARDFHARTTAIFGVLNREIPNEYRLFRCIEALKKADPPGGPIKQYILTQLSGYRSDALEGILSYGASLGKLARWIETKSNGRSYYWVSLPENAPSAVAATPEPTEPLPPSVQAIETDEKVSVAAGHWDEAARLTEPEPPKEAPAPMSQPTAPPEPTPRPQLAAVSSQKRWKVQIRLGVIEEEVLADSLFAAAQEVSRRHPEGEVIAVVES